MVETVPEINGGDFSALITEPLSASGVALRATGSLTFSDWDHDHHEVVYPPNGEAIPPNGEALGGLTAKVVTESSVVSAGVIEWNYFVPDSKLEALSKDEIRTDSFFVMVRNEADGFDTQEIRVTLVGTNDAPEFTADSVTVGTIHEAPVSGDLTDTGELNFKDVDLKDSHTVSWTAEGAPLGQLSVEKILDTTGGGVGKLVWTYTVHAEDVAPLGADDPPRVDKFDVTITDKSNVSVTQQVVVTITGSDDTTNHPPTITGGDTTGALSWLSGKTSATGAITFSDSDLLDQHIATVKPLGTVHGTLTPSISDNAATGNSTLSWTYNLSDGQTVSAADVFEVKIDDQHGGIATTNVVVSIRPATYEVSFDQIHYERNGGSIIYSNNQYYYTDDISSIIAHHQNDPGGTGLYAGNATDSGGSLLYFTETHDPYAGFGYWYKWVASVHGAGSYNPSTPYIADTSGLNFMGP